MYHDDLWFKPWPTALETIALLFLLVDIFERFLGFLVFPHGRMDETPLLVMDGLTSQFSFHSLWIRRLGQVSQQPLLFFSLQRVEREICC